MKKYQENYELKNAAKDKLDGKYGSAVLICFLASLLSGCISLLIYLYIPTTKSLALYYAIQGISSFVLSWILGTLDLGITYFFLNMASGGSYSTGDLFYCFRSDTSKTLTISGARALVSTLCLLPMEYMLDTYWYDPGARRLLAMTAVCLICLGFYVYAGLGLTLSFFLMLDFPDRSARDILRHSFQLIQGNRKKLFGLQLSFIPMELLCVCSLFVGYLWLVPYRNMTYTCFFLDLMNPREA